MKILSIYPYTHISSSALIIDGKVFCASPEERFNRKKMSTDFPIHSANWCLENAKISWDDLDYIVVPWNPQININDASSRWVSDIRWRGELLSNIPINLMRMQKNEPSNSMSVNWGNNQLIYFNHHDCHAAFGYYQSGFKEAAILTIDGHGEKETSVLSAGNKNGIKKISSINYPHSLGLFYGTFTDYLGFKADSDEWKVMALSSFNSKNINKYYKLISQTISKTKNGFELDLTYYNYYLFDRQRNFYSKKLVDLIGQPRIKNSKILDRHYGIAGALQKIYEEYLLHLIKILRKNIKFNNLIISGGAAMNCVANAKIEFLKYYKDVYVGYAPDDLGVSIGAGLLAFNKFSKKPINNIQVKSNYLGPSYDAKTIEEKLISYKIKYRKSLNIYKETAQQIADGKLVGWFQGKMEFGHRALGNRSILADPRKAKTKDFINAAVKFRESFRPFAPATLEEYVDQIFIKPNSSKVYFMEKVYKINKFWEKKLKAVSHIDGSGRVQTVSKKTNLKFYKLIDNFKSITGIPVLLNTSFNLNNEPIVMTPDDAIRTFYSCGLDILVLDNFIIYK